MRTLNKSSFGYFIGAMALVVVASNYLVLFPLSDFIQHPLAEIFTLGAFTFPLAFFINDFCHYCLGKKQARKIVLVGFFFGSLAAVGVSFVVSEAEASLVAILRIPLASACAFLLSELLNVENFAWLRTKTKYPLLPPFISSVLGSMLDTLLFFTLAFAGTGLPWELWALGDFLVKLAFCILLLFPYKEFAYKKFTPVYA